jgi:hypothetical protein
VCACERRAAGVYELVGEVVAVLAEDDEVALAFAAEERVRLVVDVEVARVLRGAARPAGVVRLPEFLEAAALPGAGREVGPVLGGREVCSAGHVRGIRANGYNPVRDDVKHRA